MRLLPVLLELLARKQAKGGPFAQGSPAFLREATIDSLTPDGRAMVTVPGGASPLTVIATPITDENLEPRNRVWVSETSEGWIIHGNVK